MNKWIAAAAFATLGLSALGQAAELSGTLVQATPRTLYLDHMGAIVPLTVDSSTEWGSGLKNGRELVEGLPIQATIEVRDRTTNLARKISVAERGTGGSGLGLPGSVDSSSRSNPRNLESPSAPGYPAPSPRSPSSIGNGDVYQPGIGGSGPSESMDPRRDIASPDSTGPSTTTY